MAKVTSAVDKLFTGPGSFKEKVPFESYPTAYGNQKLGSFGTPKGLTIPDIVQANRPPSLQKQSDIASKRISAKPYKASGGSSNYNINPPGMGGYVPAVNFDTAFGPPQQAPESQQQGSANQLVVTPTGQYQQILVKLPKKETKAKAKVTSKKQTSSKKRPSYADSEYLSEIKALDRELADYRAKMGLSKTRVGTQHQISERDLRQQKERDLDALRNDFAARGIVLSGVYGDKLGEYNTLFGQQQSELERQYKDALTDIQNQYRDYLREIGVQKEQARLAAIRRRSQKLGRL